MHETHEATSQLAENQHWTYHQHLAALCDKELAGREQRRIHHNLTESKLPIGKTLDRFEFKHLTSITGAQMSAFAKTTGWIEQAHNLILFGPVVLAKRIWHQLLEGDLLRVENEFSSQKHPY